MRYPVYVNGEVPIKALEDALSSIGLHLRIENHRMLVDPIPKQFLKTGATAAAPVSVQAPPQKMRRVK
jgi:hypothetical protein